MGKIIITFIITLGMLGLIYFVIDEIGKIPKIINEAPTTTCPTCSNECPYVNIPLIKENVGLIGYRSGFSCRTCNNIFGVKDSLF